MLFSARLFEINTEGIVYIKVFTYFNSIENPLHLVCVYIYTLYELYLINIFILYTLLFHLVVVSSYGSMWPKIKHHIASVAWWRLDAFEVALAANIKSLSGYLLAFVLSVLLGWKYKCCIWLALTQQRIYFKHWLLTVVETFTNSIYELCLFIAVVESLSLGTVSTKVLWWWTFSFLRLSLSFAALLFKYGF